MDLKDEIIKPVELQAEMKRLKKMIIGNYPWVHLSICDDCCSLTVRHDWPSRSGGEIAIVEFGNGSFHEGIKKAEAEIKDWKIRSVETNIRKLALAIIETTDEHTHCTAALLRAKGFSANQITEYHAAACARASEMCANAPFVVEGVL